MTNLILEIMKHYVRIVETLTKVIAVEADDISTARAIVKDGWRHRNFVLGGDDFCDVEFEDVDPAEYWDDTLDDFAYEYKPNKSK